MTIVSKSRPDEDLVKIGFRLDPKDWDDLELEWLWAKPAGATEYKVCSFPFFVYGISFGDVVSAQAMEGRLFFVQISRRSGHSTYRLLLAKGTTIDSVDFREHWVPLEQMGCSFELAKATWLSVDIPPQVDISVAYSRLESGENEGVWQVFEGHLGHSVKR
jgi:hypothetical protein